ncbi:AAA family ATPase [Fibrobacter sp. UWB12]|uniref:AAA family ATPase n=1 Tax=Fibrobacter sp. UWB12 TaxID=1896203 RepID=UPI00091F38A5|nr:AAA family ATPase [Fibrobacter sp. UWB12]SHK99971.1 AAA ATPase domain-containing protein [Fibrobacter sp. UWB12]
MKKMKYYIDNFRGLQNQRIDLKKINFLVGENSSGKTSIIKALAIISNVRFWMDGVISLEDVEFVCFEDMISAHNLAEEFRLGVIYDDNKLRAQILCFKNDHGMPKLCREIIIIDELLMVLQSQERISYRIKENCQKKDLEKILDNPSYVDEIVIGIEEKRIPVSFQIPIGIIPSIILENYSNIKSKQKYTEILNKMMAQRMSSGCMYIAPIRAKPQKFYSGIKTTYTSEGSHVPYEIKNIIENHENSLVSLKKFGKNSGLFDDISISKFERKGFSPFELIVKKAEKEYGVSTVGYGVSQILPIVVDMLLAKDRLVLIQQPEVHLHPKAQAAFGEFLFELACLDNKCKFVVETHSDYIIDRFRYCMNNRKIKVEADVFFTKNEGEKNIIQLIPIKENGRFDSSELAEYREFFIDESIKMMEI